MDRIRHRSPVANFPQMNFTQMHERLRQEMLRRIKRGTLSVSLLTRQTDLAQSHVSHFLRRERQFSLNALDRVLDAQHLTASDLLPEARQGEASAVDDATGAIPIVAHATAIFDPMVKDVDVQGVLRVPGGILPALHPKVSARRKTWERFVAVRIVELEAPPMAPLILPNAIALLDRHYNSLSPVRADRPNLYAVRQGNRLILRYVELRANQLVLRPLNVAFPVELMELEPGAQPGALLTGRVALVVNET